MANPSLLALLNRDGEDIARRLVFERQQRRTDDVLRIRCELEAMARATRYVTGEGLALIEQRWMEAAEERSREFTLHQRGPGDL